MEAHGKPSFVAPNIDLPKYLFSLQVGKELFNVKNVKQPIEPKKVKKITINRQFVDVKKEF